MTSHDRKTVDKIIQHCEKLQNTVTRVKTYEAFISDDDASDAAVLRLGQIGELARRELSSEFKKGVSSIPWRQIYNLRNRIVHGYDSLNLTIIWQVMTEDIPVLMEVLSRQLNIGSNTAVHRMELK